MKDSAAIYDLGLDLLRNVERANGNSLVSPISLARPLAVLAMGAKGTTREQIEDVLGASVEGALADELKDLADQWKDADSTFSLADSLWINEIFKPAKHFISLAKSKFDVEVFKRAFDQAALGQINGWVRENTHGMIDSILGKIDPRDSLYVIDACAFEGGWKRSYDEEDVEKATFRSEDGTAETVDMMYAHHASGYLEGKRFTGFRKGYENGRYAFIGLLPMRGTKVSKLLDTLGGNDLAKLAYEDSDDTVTTGLPKFNGAFTMNLKRVLHDLGVTDAFDPNSANFSSITDNPGTQPLYVSGATQKTFIEVNEEGTRASAVTSFTVPLGAAPIAYPKHHTVILDRPFVYLIVDIHESIPLFMGTVGTIH